MCPFCLHVRSMFARAHGPSNGICMASPNGGEKDSTAHNSDNRIFRITVA